MLSCEGFDLSSAEGKTEIITLCQRLAEVSVGKMGMKELIYFLKQCMIDKALSMAETQKEASELLGLSSRRMFTYKRGLK